MSVVVYTASCGARKLNYRREQRSAVGAAGYECVVRAAATIRRLPRTFSPARPGCCVCQGRAGRMSALSGSTWSTSHASRHTTQLHNVTQDTRPHYRAV